MEYFDFDLGSDSHLGDPELDFDQYLGADELSISGIEDENGADISSELNHDVQELSRAGDTRPRKRVKTTNLIADFDDENNRAVNFEQSMSGDKLAPVCRSLENDRAMSRDESLSLGALHPPPRNVLRAWTIHNPEVLYPSKATKTALSSQIGWSFGQISTWFANYRQRKGRRSSKLVALSKRAAPGLSAIDGENDSMGEAVGYVKLGRRLSNGGSSRHVAAPSSPQRPLSASKMEYDGSERGRDIGTSTLASGVQNGSNYVATWLATLPQINSYDQTGYYEEDSSYTMQSECSAHDRTVDGQWKETWAIGPCLTANDIINDWNQESIADNPENLRGFINSKSETEQDPDHKLSLIPRDQRWASTHFATYEYDEASSNSHGSLSSGASFRSSASRRGRRVPQTFRGPPRPYHCPSCNQGFLRVGDMNRHIRTVCRPTHGWVCGPMIALDLDVQRLRELSDRYVRSVLDCWNNPEPERTFFRLDHIKRHLQDTHGLGSDFVAGLDLNMLKRPLTELSNGVQG